MEKLSRIILKSHGIVLLCLGIIMTGQTILGSFKGIGVLAFIKNDPLRSVGLFEAYLLAAFSGLVLIVLSGKHYIKEWHLLAGSIHLILFTTNILFWEAYSIAGILTIGYLSTIAHAVFITIEYCCYFIVKNKITN